MGPKASGVLFQAGALGEIGKTMAVGRTRIINNFGCIEDDGSYVPANDALVSSFVMLQGLYVMHLKRRYAMNVSVCTSHYWASKTVLLPRWKCFKHPYKNMVGVAIDTQHQAQVHFAPLQGHAHIKKTHTTAMWTRDQGMIINLANIDIALQ